MNGYQCICRVSADQGNFGEAEETVYESGISKLVAGCGAFFPFSTLHCYNHWLFICYNSIS
jgi:hypothetical protein